MKVLVLGATGMLGHAVLRVFAERGRYEVFGSVRSNAAKHLLPAPLRERVIPGGNVESVDALLQMFAHVRPDIVVNCIGLVKQLEEADDPLSAISINALLPHRIARTCAATGARFVHISTDCVFAGTRGMYQETDDPDARDLYGRSKLLGEVTYPHCVTLRTSIIGHELNSRHGLLEWFLAQKEEVLGYTKAVFSGLPTVELASIVHDEVVSAPALQGLYHVSAEPIDKYSLLREVAGTYGKSITIKPDSKVAIDRSLDSMRFRTATGYRPPSWTELVRRMHEFA
jgi:dTDP-4-dehydrorhamnose reductase